jgi:hypothetical protein
MHLAIFFLVGNFGVHYNRSFINSVKPSHKRIHSSGGDTFQIHCPRYESFIIDVPYNKFLIR